MQNNVSIQEDSNIQQNWGEKFCVQHFFQHHKSIQIEICSPLEAERWTDRRWQIQYAPFPAPEAGEKNTIACSKISSSFWSAGKYPIKSVARPMHTRSICVALSWLMQSNSFCFHHLFNHKPIYIIGPMTSGLATHAHISFSCTNTVIAHNPKQHSCLIQADSTFRQM